MRHYRLAPSIAFAILIAAAAGLLGPSAASAADKPKPPPPPAASARVTFGVQPATKGAVDARPNYRYAVTPGGTLRDQVAVRNLSASAVTFRVYATDALNIDNGGFGLLPRAQRPRDVGTWVGIGGRAADGTVTVPASSVTVLPLSLKVPPKAQPGDHTGGIVVAMTTRSGNAKGTAANVELDQRIGVRMFVRVSGPARPSLTVKPIDASYENILNPFGRGVTKVTYRVTNTGNINLGGRTNLSVRGLVGPTQLSVKVPDTSLLLPGGFIDVATSVHQTWPLVREQATVTIDPLVQRGDPAGGLKKYSGTTSFWAVPWTFLTLVVVIAAGSLLTRQYRGARRARAAGAPGSAGGSGTGVGEPESSDTGTSDTGTNAPAASETRASRRSAGRWGASSTLALAAVIVASGSAAAADVPYTDANATGGITLCDAQGQAKTSGRVDVPLATTAVGGSAAVAPYDGVGRSAALFAYQPRQGVEPAEWSGQGLTALSRYTNRQHPMVEILPRDYTVGGFLEAYPAQWDGLVQLRIYLGAMNEPTKSDTYSATTLKVTGSTWQQVGASAGASCKVGRAESVIRLLGLPIASPTAKASGAIAGAPTASGSATGSLSSTSPLPSSSSRSPSTSSSSTSPLPSSSSTSPSGSSPSATGAPVTLANGESPSSVASIAAGGGGNPLMSAVSVAGLLTLALLLWFVRRRSGRRSHG